MGRRVFTGIIVAALFLSGADLWGKSGGEHVAIALFVIAGLLAVRQVVTDSQSSVSETS